MSDAAKTIKGLAQCLALAFSRREIIERHLEPLCRAFGR